MDFSYTTHFIYQSCITRVQKELERKKLHQISIYPSDKTLVSTFFNYMKYIEKGKPPKNNPYLLPKRLIKNENTDSGEPYGIVPTLGMEKFEVLWGKKDTEFLDHLELIFKYLILDIKENLQTKFPNIILVLYDYVPFAKYSTLLRIKKDNCISLLHTFGVYDEMVLPEKMDSYFFEAVQFTYDKKGFKEDFEKIFFEFASQLKSFINLPSKLKKFVESDFYDLFNKYKPSSDSLGLRVKELIEKDLVLGLELISSSKDSSNTLPKYYMWELNYASSKYIVQLENIQKKYFIFNTEKVWDF